MGSSFKDEIWRKKCVEDLKDTTENKKLRRLFDFVDYHAENIPNEEALIEYNTDVKVDWKTFSKSVNGIAAKLYSYGIKKGDIIATTLPLLKEHVYLLFAALKLGIIFTPLDLRLKSQEISYCFKKIKPKAYFFLGNTPKIDFRPIIKEVLKEHHVSNGGTLELCVQFQKKEEYEDQKKRGESKIEKNNNDVIKNAISIHDFISGIKFTFILNYIYECFGYGVLGQSKSVKSEDGAVIIFTTGSTGEPKAALLSHENVIHQCFGIIWEYLSACEKKNFPLRFLINLPISHVGGLTEQFMSTVLFGGVSVLLHVFDPEDSLKAIEKHKCTVLGQIPALFEMEWRHPNYKKYDLSSLVLIIYGGQAVNQTFLKKMIGMTKNEKSDKTEGFVGTGLGLTETAGFCTYTNFYLPPEEFGKSLGYDAPFCKISIREPMNPDGTAGKEKDRGEIGEICFEGPQIFLGYFKDEENTKRVLSKERILYTGDIGSYNENGLIFSSRRKFIIKPKGYQVFPPEIEDFIINFSEELRSSITNIGVVGVPHAVFTEAVVCVVKTSSNDLQDLKKKILVSTKNLAAYKRPSEIVFLKDDWPLNRVAKTDYLKLKTFAEKEIEEIKKIKGENW